jgi:lysophospholipase L1-like esterase
MKKSSSGRSLRALYGLIVACCLVGLTEIGLRLGGVEAAYDLHRLGRWQTTPNLTDVRMRGAADGHDFILNTNSDGLRTQIPTKRRPGVMRVAIMGDSNVFGWGLSEGETLAAQAQATSLKAGLELEVINAGQPGYSTAQMGWLFNEILGEYQPDLTILFLSMHDHNQVLVSDLEVLAGPQSLRADARVFLAKHSRIYEMIRRQLYSKARIVQLLPGEISSDARVSRVSDSERERVLGLMIDKAKTWDGHIAIGFLPNHKDLHPPPPNMRRTRHGETWAAQWSQQTQMALVDLRACCVGDPDDKVFPFDRGHLNARGNAQVGASLAKELVPILH